MKSPVKQDFLRLKQHVFVGMTILLFILTTVTGEGAPDTWNYNGTDFNTGSDWSTSTVPGAADNATFTGAANISFQPNLSSSLAIQGLTFSSSSSSGYILSNSSGSSLTLTNTGTGATSAIEALNTSGTNVISLPIILGGGAGSTMTLTQTSGGTLSISGVISESGVGTNLSITGGGAINLFGADTYTGTTTITSGTTVQLGISSVGGPGTVGSNGSLTSGSFGTGAVIANGATIDLNGQTFGNRFTVAVNGATFTNTSATTATITGAADGSLTSNVISNFNVGGSNGNINWTGQISRTAGTLGFTKIGTDSVTFSGTTANVGVSTVTVNAGTLVLGMTGTSSGAFANGVTINGGTVQFAPTLGTVSGGSTWGGQLNSTITLNSGTVDLNGSSGQNSRVQQLNGTGGIITNSSTTAAILGIAARDTNQTQTFAGTIQDGAGTVGIDFTNSGTAGSGRINLFTAANTYSGTTSVSYGTFQLGNALAAQNSPITLNVANGLTFSSGIGTFTIGGLNGNSSDSLVDVGATAVTLQLGNNNTTAIYGGQLSGTGASIVKIGTGVQEFTNTNSYTGGTSINSGTLFISGNSSALGTGTLTIGNTTGGLNATLEENFTSGAVANAITIAAGSGTRTISGVNGGGSTANFSGAVTLNNALILNEASGGSLGISGAITGSGTITAQGGGTVNISGANSGFTGNVAITGNTTLLTTTTGLNSSNTVSVDSGSQLNSSGQSVTVGGLNNGASGGGNVVISYSTGQTLNLAGSGTYAFSGQISNSGNVSKSGTGTQTLSGANTYSGSTMISGGTLVVSGSLQTSKLVVSGGSLLFGTTTPVPSSTPVTLGGGRLGITTGGGSMTLGALTLLAGTTSILDFGAASVNTVLTLTSMAISSTSTFLNVYDYNNKSGSNDHLVLSGGAGAEAGYLSQINFYSDNGTTLIASGSEVAYSGGGIEIIPTAAPEMSTLIAPLCLLALLLIQSKMQLVRGMFSLSLRPMGQGTSIDPATGN